MPRKKKESNVLKKRIKACELQIKALLAEKGLKYHASAFESESTLINGRETVFSGGGVWHCVKAAIDDVRCNAAEFVDAKFCSDMGLPSPEQSADYSDLQALYLAMIVPDLYPDVDDRLLKDPHTPELLFPALAHHKLKAARGIIGDNVVDLSEVHALLSEVEMIVEMMSVERRHLPGEKTSPLKKLKADAETKSVRVSEIRRDVAKKSPVHKEVIEFQGKVRELVFKVVSEMGKYHLSVSKETVRHLCLDLFNPQDRESYVDERYKHLSGGSGDDKNKNTTLLKQAKREVNELYEFVYELIDEFLVIYESEGDDEKSEEPFNDDRFVTHLRKIIDQEI